MDVASAHSAQASVVQLDLQAIDLPVLEASEPERAAHEDVLQQIDKASGNQTVWRKLA